MAPPSGPGTPGDGGASSQSSETAPRWVKALGVVAAILLVVFIVLHLTGNALGGHMAPGHHMHVPGARSP